jgi:hypothetical protein
MLSMTATFVFKALRYYQAVWVNAIYREVSSPKLHSDWVVIVLDIGIVQETGNVSLIGRISTF